MDISDTILSQYANQPRLNIMIRSFAQAIDPDAFGDLWYSRVFNPLTARGWGLDVWGRIVGVNRVLQVDQGAYIGFSELASGVPSNSVAPFNGGIWYTGQPSTGNYALTDDAFRRLVFAKAAANITDGSITSINSILSILFSDRGGAYVADNRDMSMTYVFEFQPDPVDLSIVYRSGVLPRPVGVKFNYTFIPAVVRNNDFGGDIS